MLYALRFYDFGTDEPEEIREDEHRRGAEQDPAPVGKRERGDFEEGTETVDDQELADQNDRSDHQATVAGGSLESLMVEEEIKNILKDTAVSLEVSGVEQVPELKQHKCREEHTQFIAGKMCLGVG